MKKWLMLTGIVTLILAMAASAACGESGAFEAWTDHTFAEGSYAGSGDSFSGSAYADTPHTEADASFAGSGDSFSGSAYADTPHTEADASFAGAGGPGGAGSASGYASTPYTTAETSVAGTGSSSSSSSYSSTTTTTTTTTSTSSSSSSSSSSDAYPSGGGFPGFDPWPPVPPVPSHHSSGSKSSSPVEYIVKSEEVTGLGWTLISKVNVRALPSTKASLVRQIGSASTEVMITSDVTNSAGVKWYGVKLYSGYVGYIRADLLRVTLDEKEDAAAVKTASAPASTVSSSVPASAGRRIIYVIVEPVAEETKEAELEPEIIYLTPEQAAEMGLLDGMDFSYPIDETGDEEPVNG
ncbi:MAG: SH3 domain-containing protein [Clostridia bacterium]|nr:SH3 domain-containing protein [Clostridia bacterium]